MVVEVRRGGREPGCEEGEQIPADSEETHCTARGDGICQVQTCPAELSSTTESAEAPSNRLSVGGDRSTSTPSALTEPRVDWRIREGITNSSSGGMNLETEDSEVNRGYGWPTCLE